jgi:putative two-component system response regulator
VQEVRVAIRSAGLMEEAGAVVTVRELLDTAHDKQGTDTDAARALAQKARVLARTVGDPVGEASALYRLASIAFLEGHSDDAFAIALDARELARKLNATDVEVGTLSLVSVVYYNAGNFPEALECALQALELCRSTDRRGSEGNLLNTVAAIHHSLGDTDRALVTYEAALTVNRELNQPEYDALTLTNMAEVRSARNENLLAVSLHEAALELSRAHNERYVPAILAGLGDTYLKLDALDRAEECLDEAQDILTAQSETTSDMRTTGVAVAMTRGRVAIARGDLHLASEEFRGALALATASSLRENVMHAHQELASVYKRLGRFEEALAHQEARFSQHEELFNSGTDLRIKTLQIAHDSEAARQQAEILRLRTGELEAMVRGRTYDLEEYQLQAFGRLAVLAEVRGSTTTTATEAGADESGEHTTRVGDLAADIATELGEPNHWARQLRLATRLHDIGKVVVSDTILLKPGRLTPGEFDSVKRHTTAGAEILAGSSSPLIQLASIVALNHHERWDGGGYPAGLSGTDIPLAGRIGAISDVFDALTSTRIYRPAFSTIAAIEQIVSGRGTQFDPRVVDAFLRVATRLHPEHEAQLISLHA